MAMDKRWQETFDRLDAIEAALKELKAAVLGTSEKEAPEKKTAKK